MKKKRVLNKLYKTCRSVGTKLGCEPNPILPTSSPIQTIETQSSLQSKLTPPEEFNSVETGAERSLEPDLTEQKRKLLYTHT